MNPFDVGPIDFDATTDYPQVETEPACIADGDEATAVLDILEQIVAGCLVIADDLADGVAVPQLQRDGVELV